MVIDDDAVLDLDAAALKEPGVGPDPGGAGIDGDDVAVLQQPDGPAGRGFRVDVADAEAPGAP